MLLAAVVAVNRRETMNKHLKITILGAGAIASGLVQAEQSVSLHQMQYKEDDQRIKVADTSLALKLDFGVDYSLDLSIGYDSVSGASPSWAIKEPKDATVEDWQDRKIKLLKAQQQTEQTLLGYINDVKRYYVKRYPLTDVRKSMNGALTIRDSYRNELTLGLSHSRERDYQSNGVSAAYLLFLDQYKNRSLNVGFSYLDDKTQVARNSVEQTQFVREQLITEFGQSTVPRQQKKIQSIGLELGFTQVLSPSMTFDLTIFGTKDSGYLSNHYLRIVRHIDGNENAKIESDEFFLAADSRPNNRTSYGTKLSLATQPWPWLTGKFSYRFYTDDWDIASHTLANSLSFEVFDGLFITPEFTWYQQTKASFYRNQNGNAHYFASSGYGSNDVRLGDFDAQTYSLALSYQFTKQWQIDLAANRYQQSNQFAATWLVAGINYKF